ncbi:WGR domain-containing protein, partial [Myxococcota bacterium]|nr:WGR domain-containing protein [Myxococcota bacterium]MBU1897392.1 WGR domain-containing protein [Myxococcota bacterium]
MLSYFTRQTKHSAWFWGVERCAASALIHSGRLGKPGAARIKIFKDEATAEAALEALQAEKLRKGYVAATRVVEPPEPEATLFQVLGGFWRLIEQLESHPRARLLAAQIAPGEGDDPLGAITQGITIRYGALSRYGEVEREATITVDPAARAPTEAATAFFEAQLIAAQAQIDALGEAQPRHDLLITDQSGGFALTQRKAREVMNHLLGLGIIAVREAWFERDMQRFEFGPGPLAHRVFIKGRAPDEPPFYEGSFSSTTQPSDLPFGEGAATAYLELRGCLYPALGAGFLVRFGQLLNFRLQTTHRPFTGLRPASP